MTDSPYQEVPGTPYLNHWSSCYDSQSPVALVPSGLHERYDDHTFSVPSTTATPRRYLSPFVVPSNSPWTGGTPRQRPRSSVINDTIQTTLIVQPAEQVVPSTPNQQDHRQHIFGTPTSTPRRPLRRQYVSREKLLTPGSEYKGTPNGDKDTVNVVVMDPSGDHHRDARLDHKGNTRKVVAMLRKSLISQGTTTSSTSDFLDEIQTFDL